MPRRLTIVYFQRKRREGRNFSLEQIFEDLRCRMQDQFNATLWTAPFTSSGLLRRMYIAVAAVFAQRDINHVTGDINFCTLFMRRRKTVLTILDCGILARTKGIKRFVIWLFWFQLPVWRCRYVTVISSSTKELLLREVSCSTECVKIVPVAISPSFVPSPKVFRENKPLILHVGTAPNKNLPRVAQALQGVHCRLKVVGPLDNDQRRSLEENEVEYEQVQGLSQQELVECYQACDLVAFVSTHEGFGMPILEANATGRPVVTSNVTSMPEVAGNAACLVNPFDVESIRAGIKKIIEDPVYRTQLIENGYQNVLRFNAGEIARQYAELYLSILNRK